MQQDKGKGGKGGKGKSGRGDRDESFGFACCHVDLRALEELLMSTFSHSQGVVRASTSQQVVTMHKAAQCLFGWSLSCC